MRIPGHVPTVSVDPAADPWCADDWNFHAAGIWTFRCSCGAVAPFGSRSAAQDDMSAHMLDRAAAIGLACMADDAQRSPTPAEDHLAWIPLDRSSKPLSKGRLNDDD